VIRRRGGGDRRILLLLILCVLDDDFMVRRGALPEASPVAAVHVHVAAKRLRGPELPAAEGAGVGSRRPHAAAEVPRRVLGERQLLP
jgi:hypothetical protein